MRMSRPVAVGVLVLLAALVLWLMLSQGGGSGDAAGPERTGAEASSDTTFGSMESSDEAAPDAGGDAVSSGADAGSQPDSQGSGEDDGDAEPTHPVDPDVLGRPSGVDTRPNDDIDACADDDLPGELDPVVRQIEQGGPYAYPGKDGSTFGNFEGYLPGESRGYYREFTVDTPGLDHRGAKRVVTGGDVEWLPDVWYYTDDHYESFCEFAPAG